MSGSEPIRIVGKLALAFVYKCRKCGCEKRGDFRDVDVDACSPTQIQELLELERASANEMPVDWASVYGPQEIEYLCEDCILKGMKL